MIDKTREIALKILYEIEKEKAYSNIILNKYIKEKTFIDYLNKTKNETKNKHINLQSTFS